MKHPGLSRVIRHIGVMLALALIISSPPLRAENGKVVAGDFLAELVAKLPDTHGAAELLRAHWIDTDRLSKEVTRHSVQKSLYSVHRCLKQACLAMFDDLHVEVSKMDIDILKRHVVFGDSYDEIAAALRKRNTFNFLADEYKDNAVRQRANRAFRLLLAAAGEVEGTVLARSAEAAMLNMGKTISIKADAKLAARAARIPQESAKYLVEHARNWGKFVVVGVLVAGAILLYDSDLMAAVAATTAVVSLELSEVDLRYRDGDLDFSKVSYDSSKSLSENIEENYEVVRTAKVRELEKPLVGLGLPRYLATPLAILIILIGLVVYGRASSR